MRVPRALLALVCALSLGEANAHATLISTSPFDGASLAAAPAQVVLVFDEPVAPLLVRLVDDAGAAVGLLTAVRSEGATLVVTLPPVMRDGSYVLSYRVASVDSHPVAGSMAFSIGPVDVARYAVADAAGSGPDGWQIGWRALRDAMLLVAAGGALFLLGVGPFPGQRLIVVATGLVGALLSIAGIGLQGALLLGQRDVWVLASWRTGMSTSFGLSATVASAAALAIASGALVSAHGLRRTLLASGAFAVGASLALTGHAVAVHPAALAVTAVTAHALAAAFWTGSLVALYTLLRRDAGSEAATALRRFSNVAVAAMVVLVAAGTTFAALQLGSLSALADTRYGNLILAKAGLLAILLVIAARNRFFLMPRLARPTPDAVPRLRRAIGIELGLVAIVLCVTAALTQTAPRADTFVTMSSKTYNASLTVAPAHPGRNVITATIRDREARPIDAAELTLEIANPAVGIEPMSRRMVRGQPGEYRYEGGELAFEGRWQLTLRARIGDFESIEFAAVVTVR